MRRCLDLCFCSEVNLHVAGIQAFPFGVYWVDVSDRAAEITSQVLKAQKSLLTLIGCDVSKLKSKFLQAVPQPTGHPQHEVTQLAAMHKGISGQGQA